jgi:hypothetical protein
LHRGLLKEIDFDGDDAGKEGLKVVGGHFFEGVETGEGKAAFCTWGRSVSMASAKP